MSSSGSAAAQEVKDSLRPIRLKDSNQRSETDETNKRWRRHRHHHRGEIQDDDNVMSALSNSREEEETTQKTNHHHHRRLRNFQTSSETIIKGGKNRIRGGGGGGGVEDSKALPMETSQITAALEFSSESLTENDRYKRSSHSILLMHFNQSINQSITHQLL